MKLLLALLLMAGVSCERKLVENQWLDKVLERTNVAVRKDHVSVLSLPNGQLREEISYSDGMVLGLDSFYRTSDYTTIYNGTHFFADIHYGFKFLAMVFKNITIDGNDMSAFFRVRDNSIHFSYYLRRIYGCRFLLDTLEVERLGNVEFESSRQEYDGTDVEEVFGKEVLSAVNGYLSSHKDEIEKELQILCHPHEMDKYHEPPYLAFVRKFFYN